jgi:uncharacterized membrane protein
MISVTHFFSSLIRRPAREPAIFFTLTTLFFGFIFILLVPPFQNPDEFIHFVRSYEVSELKIAHRIHRGKVDIKGSELPKSIDQTYIATHLHRSPQYPDIPVAKKYTLHKTANALKITLNKSQMKPYDTAASPAYPEILYAPQALVIRILSSVNASVILMLYATRVACLLAWVGLARLSINILRPPNLKFALAVILLIPMFVAQGVVPGVDAVLTGLTVLFFVLIANSLIEKKILSPKLIIILTVLLTAMTLAKPAYLVFGLLALALRSRWRGVKGLAYSAAVPVLTFLVYLIWLVITKDAKGPIYIDSIAIAHADPSAQVGFLIPNVFHFVGPFLNTLLLGWGDNIVVSVIGMFGKLDTPLPLLFVVLGYLLIIIAVFVKTDNEADVPKLASAGRLPLKLLIIGSVILYIIGVYLSMYIFSTPPHEKIITGVQGRYFLPLLPLLVLFVRKRSIVMKASLYTKLLHSLPLLLLAVSALVVFLRYYVYYP